MDKFRETWQRTDPCKPLPQWKRDELCVEPVDIDYTVIKSNTPEHEYIINELGEYKTIVPNTCERTVIRMFCVNMEYDAVTIIVHNFLPYIRVKTDFPDEILSQDNTQLCNRVMDLLNECREENNPYVVRCTLERRTDIESYDSYRGPFYKLELKNPRDVPSLRDLIQKTKILDRRDFGYARLTYDSKIEFHNRFMVDVGVMGCGWIKIDAKKWKMRPYNMRITNDWFDADIDYRSIIPQDMTQMIYKPSRLVSLYYDIEVITSRVDLFPSADNLGDQIVQIANYVFQGDNPQPLHVVTFCLGSVEPIPHATVCSYDDEKNLLMDWHDFYIAVNPDLESGYNIIRFDRRYLQERSHTLKISKEFEQFSKLRDVQTPLRYMTFASKAMGRARMKMAHLHGRCQFDMFLPIVCDTALNKLPDYKLNTVARKVLKDTKEDLHHTLITKHHETDRFTRQKLAIYCLKDALLPRQVDQKKYYVGFYVELARLCYIPLRNLLDKGQQMRVMSLVLLKTLSMDFSIPFVEYDFDDAKDKTKGFKGALVVNPRQGLYTNPVPTLDFMSLYPSIMIAHNLCYTTFVKNGPKPGWILNEDYIITPAGHCFVTPKIRKGILATILLDILAARNVAKKEMSKYKQGSDEWNCWNAIQMALKVLANSIYGFCGVKFGKIRGLAIADSVTSYAREMLAFLISVVHGCKIITPYYDYTPLPPKKSPLEKTPVSLKLLCMHKIFSLNGILLQEQIDGIEFGLEKAIEILGEYMPIVIPPKGWKHNTRLCLGLNHTALTSQIPPQNEGTHEIVYGDTDSVMNWLKLTVSILNGMFIGKALSIIGTNCFHPAIVLQFEKVLFNFLLKDRKDYAGLHYEKTHLAPDMLNRKGGSVKRDIPVIVKQTTRKVLSILLGYNKKRKPAGPTNIDGAIKYAQEIHHKHLSLDIPFDNFIMGKTISQLEYNPKPAHAYVAEKRAQRDPEDRVVVGERVEYVYVMGTSDMKQSEKAEDPTFAKQQGMRIDTNVYMKYLRHALCKTLFPAIMPGDSWRHCCPQIEIKPGESDAEWKKSDNSRRKKHYDKHIYPIVKSIIFSGDYSRLVKHVLPDKSEIFNMFDKNDTPINVIKQDEVIKPESRLQLAPIVEGNWRESTAYKHAGFTNGKISNFFQKQDGNRITFDKDIKLFNITESSRNITKKPQPSAKLRRKTPPKDTNNRKSTQPPKKRQKITTTHELTQDDIDSLTSMF